MYTVLAHRLSKQLHGELQQLTDAKLTQPQKLSDSELKQLQKLTGCKLRPLPLLRESLPCLLSCSRDWQYQEGGQSMHLTNHHAGKFKNKIRHLGMSCPRRYAEHDFHKQSLDSYLLSHHFQAIPHSPTCLCKQAWLPTRLPVSLLNGIQLCSPVF